MKDETLAKLHQFEIYALDEVDRICRKHNLVYYLVGGTLLGAVRHHGFIPWDDDLDIAMPRDDFEKFFELAKEELNDRFYLQSTFSSEGYNKIFAKIRINNTVFLQEDVSHIQMHHGVFIDIFPLDSGKQKRSLTVKIKTSISNLLTTHISARKGIFPLVLKHRLLSFIPVSFCVKLRDALLKGRGDYYLNYGSQYGIVKQTIAKSHYDPPCQLEFEGKEYMAPCDYIFILERLYGDNFMELPPLEKRRTHNPVRLSFDTNGPDENLGE